MGCMLWAWRWSRRGYWRDASYHNLRIGPLYVWWLHKDARHGD